MGGGGGERMDKLAVSVDRQPRSGNNKQTRIPVSVTGIVYPLMLVCNGCVNSRLPWTT